MTPKVVRHQDLTIRKVKFPIAKTRHIYTTAYINSESKSFDFCAHDAKLPIRPTTHTWNMS